MNHAPHPILIALYCAIATIGALIERSHSHDALHTIPTAKPPPFTTEITTCTGIVNGEVIAVTVEGTVRAHKKQNQIRLIAFANRRILGDVALGDFEAGQEKPFRVTGNIPSQERKPLSCRVELKSLAP